MRNEGEIMKIARLSLLLAGLCSGPLMAAGLEASLSAPQEYIGAGEDVRLELTLTNTDSKPINLLKWKLPSTEDAPLFEVLRDGQPVAYQGALIKRPSPTAKDFIQLNAGESLTLSSELSALYDLNQSGQYSIRYKLPILTDAAGSKRAKATTASASNSVTIWVEGLNNSRLSKAAEIPGLATAAAGVSFNSCSNTQQSKVLNALTAATTLTNNSKRYLLVDKPTGARYKTWFGAYNSSRWNTVEGNFLKISDAIANKPLSFDCSCRDSYYAYVYPNQPYKVYLCQAFWSAPQSGTDSKAGTIIHELSHFTVVAGTDDLAYGQSAAKALAASYPDQAIQNADSHEYFSENTPYLP